MKQLLPMVESIEFDYPTGGRTLCSPEWVEPNWMASVVSKIFLGRSPKWLSKQLHAGLIFEGKPVEILTFPNTDKRYWRLYDVEVTCWAMYDKKVIDGTQLIRAINTVRLIAETNGLLPARPVPIKTSPIDVEPEGNVYLMTSVVEYTDDLDGSPGAQPRTFSIGSVSYNVHLTDGHYQELIAQFAPYIKVARTEHVAIDDSSQRELRQRIRQWARNNNISVPARGKIPVNVMNQWYAAQHGEW